MSETTIEAVPDDLIISKIYYLRGHKVMLDMDLSRLYEVETRRLNEQVKRNPKRFPEDFMFQLSEDEFDNLMSHFATSSWGGTRKMPYAFTEHGVLMLSSVLKSDRAVEANIKIMRVFSKIRQMLSENTELRLAIEKLERKTEDNTRNIEVVFQYVDELAEKKKETRKAIGYKLSEDADKNA
jgi:hypothetical protein